MLCVSVYRLERTVAGGRASRFRRISRRAVFACADTGHAAELFRVNDRGALSRVLRLPRGRSQSSSTISSWQGYPANAFYNVRGCAGFGRSIMNESGPTTFPVVDTFPLKPVLLCGRFIGPRAMGRRNGVEAVVSEPARNNGL